MFGAWARIEYRIIALCARFTMTLPLISSVPIDDFFFRVLQRLICLRRALTAHSFVHHGALLHSVLYLQDKWNTDWAHPWCAYPAAAIPRLLLGVQPLLPGWTRARIAPQPGSLAAINASVPTNLGMLSVMYAYVMGHVTVTVEAPAQMAVTVCLAAPPGTRAGKLSVNGSEVKEERLGRLLCAPADLGAGVAVVQLQVL